VPHQPLLTRAQARPRRSPPRPGTRRIQHGDEHATLVTQTQNPRAPPFARVCERPRRKRERALKGRGPRAPAARSWACASPRRSSRPDGAGARRSRLVHRESDAAARRTDALAWWRALRRGAPGTRTGRPASVRRRAIAASPLLHPSRSSSLDLRSRCSSQATASWPAKKTTARPTEREQQTRPRIALLGRVDPATSKGARRLADGAACE
jgi:hypothetical protein